MNNQVSFDRVMLNLTTSVQGLNLKKGEVVKGLVHGVRDNGLIMLALKGRMTEAFCQFAVRPGQELFLIVDGFRDGKAYLKPVTPVQMEQMENANIRAQLSEQGIPARNENIMMAKKLIQHNMPVTQSNLSQLEQGSRILGEFNQRNLEITAFAISRGMEINSQTLNALSQFLSGNNMANMFSDIKTLLNNLNNSSANQNTSTNTTPNRAPNTQQPTVSNNASQQINTSTNTGNINSNPSQPQINITSSDTPRGNTMEPNQNRPILTQNQTNQNINISDASNLTNNTLPSRSIASNLLFTGLQNIFTQMVRSIEINPNQSSLQQISNAIQNNVLAENELLKNLVLLKEFVKNTRINNPVINQIFNSIESFEKELSGQRAFNSLPRLTGDNSVNYYYFSIPVLVEEEYKLFSIKINKGFKNKTTSQLDNFKLIVSHDTNNMGIVLFHINWYKSGELTLKGVVESEEVSKHLSKNINKLLQKLKTLGFSVTDLGIKVAEDSSEIDVMRPKIEEEVPVMKTFSIDVTV
ncbi:hypothetical protein SYNTR_1359 [Candidatus Syntrophocurvum alkaliphilum]|uniref:Flagellar hook-length control protein-like C-terminal domain-containing protein n=1 Tax=Candidatus Syntrophocurvum alkaliphilum TaxID=2293317 RepID=A0A6I6DGD5_9FIRM|nr:hypothetical protein [Candidatus Syntrophocurvum alkaliphilum]QGT99952.1 hypothetical protein SYNTR_1359 [Candidatus Syntrophocurvum alkaliphilum]